MPAIEQYSKLTFLFVRTTQNKVVINRNYTNNRCIDFADMSYQFDDHRIFQCHALSRYKLISSMRNRKHHTLKWERLTR